MEETTDLQSESIDKSSMIIIYLVFAIVVFYYFINPKNNQEDFEIYSDCSQALNKKKCNNASIKNSNDKCIWANNKTCKKDTSDL